MHPCDVKDYQLCSRVCNKAGNKHECSCHDDYELEEDGKTCVKGNLSAVIPDTRIRKSLLPGSDKNKHFI